MIVVSNETTRWKQQTEQGGIYASLGNTVSAFTKEKWRNVDVSAVLI
jgi:hypothetical protein